MQHAAARLRMGTCWSGHAMLMLPSHRILDATEGAACYLSRPIQFGSGVIYGPPTAIEFCLPMEVLFLCSICTFIPSRDLVGVRTRQVLLGGGSWAMQIHRALVVFPFSPGF